MASYIYADMHIHSTYSDGSDTPVQLVARAKARGLKAMVLTDHDNTAGWEEVSAAAKGAGIETIPGVEISTSIERVDVHVLGYGIDPGNEALRGYLERMCLARRERIKAVLEELNALGIFHYPWEKAVRHLEARAFVCSFDLYDAMAADDALPGKIDKNDFYFTYFSNKSPTYRSIEGFSPEEAIDMISLAGGVPVIAHPKLIGDDNTVRELLAYGARGLEVWYPAHDAGDRVRYMEMVREYGGIATGGTDWHGDYAKWNVALGDCGARKDVWDVVSAGPK